MRRPPYEFKSSDAALHDAAIAYGDNTRQLTTKGSNARAQGGVVLNNTDRRRIYRSRLVADRRASFAQALPRQTQADRKGLRHEVDEGFACCRRD